MLAARQSAAVAGGDAEEVRAFLHRGAQLAQLGGHGGDAVGLLHAPAGDVAQRGGAVGVQGHAGQGHGRVGDVVAVQVDGLQGPGAARDVQPVGAAGHLGAHGLGGFDKADVALDRVLAHAQHLDAILAASARGNGAQCYEIAGGGGVGLDVDVAGRLVAAAGRNHEALPALVAHGDAKARQQLQRDVDVGLGDQFAHHLDADVAVAGQQGQGHQQRGQELAGDIAAHGDGGIAQLAEVGLADAQGRIAGVAQVVDVAAQLAQGVHQIADGALVHARHAGHLEVATQHGQGRRQRAHGGAGIAQEQLRARIVGQGAVDASDLHRLARGDLGGRDLAAQLAQRGQHDAGVVRVQQVVDGGGAGTQGGQQQHAVGNAFGAGQLHAAAGGGQVRQVKKGGLVHA